MKIIFLDVDGVLNSEEIVHTKQPPRCLSWLGIESKKVKLLRQIVEATDAKIVLVSSWKKGYVSWLNNRASGQVELCDHLGKYLHNKLSKERLHIFATTAYYERNSRTRGLGINGYLRDHPAEAFVILDDEVFDDYCAWLKDGLVSHLVKTNPYTGLTEADVAKAIEILNR